MVKGKEGKLPKVSVAMVSYQGKNYIKDPGLHRTLSGDGLATMIASLFGAPAHTTYGGLERKMSWLSQMMGPPTAP